MIDVHSHVLFGIDDGAKTIEESIEMFRVAHNDGIKKVIATSHCLPGLKYENDITILKPVYDQCCEAIKENHFDVELIFGCELMATPLSLTWLKAGRVATINHTRWLLLELPWHASAMFTIDVDQYLNSVLEMGYKILLAHPERYPFVQEDCGLMEKWRKMGCAFQLNKSSFLEDTRPKDRDLAWKMLKEGYCDIIASDAHRSTGIRKNKLSDIYDQVALLYGEIIARRLMIDNPQRLLDGLDLEVK
jgi:protein-tyrosine phosphatase